MLNTGKIYLHKILRNTYVEHRGKIYLHKILREYFMLNTKGRFLSTYYWGILYVEHCGKIYLHKILREYFMLNTKGQAWRIRILNIISGG